jgi:hypothetical protein
MVRRGSTVRVRQRALQEASKWAFLLPRRRTFDARPPHSLSPRPAPNLNVATDSRREQTRRRAQRTSVVGRDSVRVSLSDVAGSWRQILAGGGLAKPGLVGHEAPDRLVLVIPHPRGDELTLANVDGRDPEGSIDERVVDPRPERSRPSRALELEP